jgi:hypothetical protein
LADLCERFPTGAAVFGPGLLVDLARRVRHHAQKKRSAQCFCGGSAKRQKLLDLLGSATRTLDNVDGGVDLGYTDNEEEEDEEEEEPAAECPGPEPGPPPGPTRRGRPSACHRGAEGGAATARDGQEVAALCRLEQVAAERAAAVDAVVQQAALLGVPHLQSPLEPPDQQAGWPLRRLEGQHALR